MANPRNLDFLGILIAIIIACLCGLVKWWFQLSIPH